MGDVAAEEPAEHQPAAQLRSGVPDDLLEQVLCFLPPIQVIRCCRASRAFLRAALASLERTAWPADPAGASHSDSCCRAGNGGSNGSGGVRGGGLVGTPCLDLRDAGDAVDSRALLAVLGRIFMKPRGSTSNVVGARADGEGGEGGGGGEGESRGSAVRKPAVLKGFAVHSAVITDEAIGLALKLHGAGLEVLDLAGCGGLDSVLTMTTIRQHCKRLVALDLSGPFGESAGGAGAPPEAGAFAGLRVSGYGLFQNHMRKLPLVFHHLLSLLSAVGGDLLVLRLRDRPDISNAEVRVIAEGCNQLREFDIGTGSRMGRLANITGQGLGYLYQAPCALSLVCLGLRNQQAIGHLDLRALGSQLPRLRRLDLAGLVKADDEVLKALASTLSLSHVDLSRAHHVSAAGVSALARASPELECVSLHGIVGVTDGAVRALCDACPKLRHMNVSMTRVTERGLRLLAVKDSLRWVNIRCCSCLLDSGPTRRLLASFRSRLSTPQHPRDRGTVLGMERPQTQLRARPPSRSPRRPHGGGGRGHQGPPDDGTPTGAPGVGGGECRPLFPSGCSGNAHRSDVGPSGTDGGGVGGGGSAAAAATKPASAEGRPGEASGRKSSSSVSPTRDTASAPPGMDKGARRGEASIRDEEERNHPHPHAHAHAHSHAHSHAAAAAPAGAPASMMSAGKEPPATASAASTAAAVAAVDADAAATPPAAAIEALAAPCRADPLPLLPAGVGNLSLGQHRRRMGTQRRAPSNSSLKAVGTTPWDFGDPTLGLPRSKDERHQCGEGEDANGRGGGAEAVENEAGVVVPFDWDTIPRGSVGDLGAWRGFRGLSGDLVRKVIHELHPYAQVGFRTESDSLLGPPTRKNNHGYLVHTSTWGQAWVEFEVDDQGCVA